MGYPSGYTPGSLYYYTPSRPAAILFAVLFGISGIVHSIQSQRYKSWRYTGVLPYAAALFVAGFAIRAIATDHVANIGLFIGSEICILIAPPIYALCLYFTLGRALYYVPWLSPIHPGRVRTTFVSFDIVCGALMGAGGARFGNTALSESQRQIGVDLVKAGMLVQVVLQVSFIVLCAIFHRRCVRAGVEHKLKWIFVTLYVCAIFILWRSIFRSIEFFEGYLGNIYTHEAYYYCFDILVMFFVTFLLHVLHPARFLPQFNKTYLATDGVTEREGPGWDDRRNFVVTMFNPFDIHGLIHGRDKKDRFWETDETGAISANEVNGHGNVASPDYSDNSQLGAQAV